MINKIIFLFFLLQCCFITQAQFQNILISNNNSPSEVSIAINPKNTNQIIAGAVLNNNYASNDGGQTWVRGILTCDSFGVYGDPVLFWDTTGSAYYMHLSNPPRITTGGSWVDRIVIQKSGDAGRTYPICVGVGKNQKKVQDKPWVAVNTKSNSIHITWTQFDAYESDKLTDSTYILYSKSLDGGLNWTTPKRISAFAGDCKDGDNTVEGAVPAIGANGEVYVVWNGPKGLVFQKSINEGETWLPKETTITTTAGGWDYNITGLQRANGLPFTMCDASNSAYKGTVYVNWSDQRNGEKNADIFVIKSTDGGSTWNKAVKVNNDTTATQQFMSTMNIDQTNGNVYVLFYDRSRFLNNDSTDVTVAVSTNGGETFDNYKINQQSFKPTNSVFFGDYIGISAHNDVVRPVWMQVDNGKLGVYTALINAQQLNKIIELEKNIKNIFVKTNIALSKQLVEFDVTQASLITAQLTNSEGKDVEKFKYKKKLKVGKHLITIKKRKLKLLKGDYYFYIFSDKKNEAIKLHFD